MPPPIASTISRRSARDVGNILSETGPVFVAIKVIPEVENEPIGRRQRRPTRSRAETIRDLQAGTGSCSRLARDNVSGMLR